MKKNNMLRIASVLLVAVLLSTCAISGAFAKYTTSGTAITDDARVAIFGIEIENGTDNALFSNTYSNTSSKVTVYNENDKLVAPGTDGELVDGFTITDADREVAVEVKPDVTLTLTGFDSYCPLVFNVNGDEYKINPEDEDMDSTADLVAAVKKAIVEALGGEVKSASTSKIYYPSDKINNGAAALDVSWSWAFEGEKDAEGQYIYQTDALDNTLKEGNARIELSIELTIDQID